MNVKVDFLSELCSTSFDNCVSITYKNGSGTIRGKKMMALIIIKKIITMMAASYQTAGRICFTLTALRRNKYNLEYRRFYNAHGVLGLRK